MSMDLLFIAAIVGELNQHLCGAVVGKIHQPSAHELVFRLWNGRENLHLLLSASPRAARLHLTEERFLNPGAPPRFCQLLRSRLNRLLEIDQVKGERIVRLHFSGEGGRRWSLVHELLGSRANLLLLDEEQRIVDALHRTEFGGRTIGPGEPYRLPRVTERFDLGEGVPEIPDKDDLRAWLGAHLVPMTPLAAADIAAGALKGATPESLLERFRLRFLRAEFEPCIVRYRGKPVLCAVMPEHLELEACEHFARPSLAADRYFANDSAEEGFYGRKVLAKTLGRETVRLHKRLKRIEQDRRRALQSDRQRELGDLLLANLHRLSKGMEAVRVEDWYADPPAEVTVPLDPTLTPQQNAEAYFRRHRKGRKGLEHAERRELETLEELEWLETVSLALEEAHSPSDLWEIRQELQEAGVLRDSSSTPLRRRAEPAESKVHRATTPGGYRLFWGRNNRTNDYVTQQLTGKDDLWMHARNLPGAHLVLKTADRPGEVPEEDLLFAAALAAGYSRGREESRVEVMVAAGRDVKKPKGARPGLVTVRRSTTLTVVPSRL